ncbi:MAG: nucleotide excision repair endonuclease, partial [Candidatus Neomarinimicrobiota bacterium]
MPNPRQKTLFIGNNPLKDRFDKNFFNSIPTGYGIYKMYDELGTMLYVGKSVNLRARIQSYTRINSNNANYKLNQLVSLVYKISWATTENETEALLLENSIIRELQPAYNQAKKNFRQYSFLTISTIDPNTMRFRILEDQPNLSEPHLYGAFKSSRAILGALYKFQWFFKFFDDLSRITRLNPEATAGYYSKLDYNVHLPVTTSYPVKMWDSWIRSYFKGTLST